MSEPTSSNSKSSTTESYWMMSITFCELPVLAAPWMPAHWVELLPSWVAEKSWSISAASPSCSSSWVTCAMAGMAATASIARSAASIINFFIPLLLFLSTRQSLQGIAQTTITLSNRVEHYATLEPNIKQHPATSSIEESYAQPGTRHPYSPTALCEVLGPCHVLVRSTYWFNVVASPL